VIFFKCCCK